MTDAERVRELEAEVERLKGDYDSEHAWAEQYFRERQAAEAEAGRLRSVIQWEHDRLGKEQKFYQKYPHDRWMECAKDGDVIRKVRERLRAALSAPAEPKGVYVASKVKHAALWRQLRAGWPKDTLAAAEERMRRVLSIGVIPMAMLWRDQSGKTSYEWLRFARTWIKPQIIGTTLREVA